MKLPTYRLSILFCTLRPFAADKSSNRYPLSELRLTPPFVFGQCAASANGARYMRTISALVLSVAVAGCAASPMQSVVQLNTEDPKYGSEDCRATRQLALQFNDHTISRAGLGLATGLLLGPIGIIPAAMADMSANERRAAVNAELIRHCVTPGWTASSNSSASGDTRVCTPQNGQIVCQ